MKKLTLTFLGFDSWSRPVYDDGTGRLLVDVDPREGRAPDICTKYGNAFNGEPCDPIQAEFTFAPHRVTWNQFQYNTKMPQKQGNQEGGNDYGNSQA